MGTEKKGQALLYDMDTSDRNSSRMTAARSIGSTKSYKKKKNRLEDVKNPIEKLTIMMERIKNSKAANEEYRKKVIEGQQARIQNMRANLEQEEFEKETENCLREQREASEEINRQERREKKRKEFEAKGIKYDESMLDGLKSSTDIEPDQIVVEGLTTEESKGKMKRESSSTSKFANGSSANALNSQKNMKKANNMTKTSDAKGKLSGKAKK